MSRRNSVLLPISRSSNKRILVVMLVAPAALIVDTIINNVADFITSSIVSSFGIALFILICIVYGMSQYFILEIVKLKLEEVRIRSRYLNLMHRIVTTV